MRILGIVLLLLLGAMLWQHVRYLNLRRDVVQDHQELVYPASRFHVITYLGVAEGEDVINAIAALRREIEAVGAAKMVYAGQAALTVESSQLAPQNWDAVVLVEYPSRSAYEAAAESSRQRDALASFRAVYSHGMARSPVANLLLPQLLLALRAGDILRGNWNVEELEPASVEGASSEQVALFRERMKSLLSLASVNDEAVVIFNLAKPGSEAEQARNRSYGLTMLTRMAALAHGPMHLGSAVPVEGDAQFDDVVIVYYPGVDYFSRLARSRFFQGIIGDKQLGDTLVVLTVPILSRLGA